MHMHENKVGTPTQPRIQKTKRFEEPTCSSERLRSSQRRKISLREVPPLLDRRARQRARPIPEAGTRGTPTGPAGAHGGKVTSPTTQARLTSSISAVSSCKSIKWQPFPIVKPTYDTRPATCQESRCGSGETTREAFPGDQ